jgi:hypothetical protein
MGIIKHFLLIGLLISYVGVKPLLAHAEDEDIIRESDVIPSNSSVPMLNSAANPAPVLIDESDSSVTPDTNDDYDN